MTNVNNRDATPKPRMSNLLANHQTVKALHCSFNINININNQHQLRSTSIGVARDARRAGT